MNTVKLERNTSHVYDSLRALLIGRAYVRYESIDYERWGAECGIGAQKLRRRLRDMGDLTLEELRSIARPLGIDSLELRQALPL